MLRAFAPRVDEPQRQDPARYRPLTLRRGVRSVEAVLDGMIDRECEYQALEALKLRRYGARHEHDESEHLKDCYEIRRARKQEEKNCG
jgi:hypothetical protein